MKKNLYYAEVLQRENIFIRGLLDLFYAFTSYPRLMLEVFIRKNFGERYFNLGSVITVAVFMILLPVIWSGSFVPVRHNGYYSHSDGSESLWRDNWLWYLFTIAFLGFSILRWLEVRRNPSVFDFKRYSKDSGDIHPFFRKIKIFGKPVTVRMIEIYLEPLPFFVLGFLLWLMNQNLGILLMVSSIFYGMGYAGAYRIGDNFVMDKIDQMILNEEMEDAFVNDADPRKTRGVRFFSRKPNSKELRELLMQIFFEGDDDDDSAVAA